jgi:hypothetical protein
MVEGKAASRAMNDLPIMEITPKPDIPNVVYFG